MNEQTIREYIRKRDIYSPHVADLPDGKVFIKSGDEGSLSCEAEGLETIRATGKIYVPEILLAWNVRSGSTIAIPRSGKAAHTLSNAHAGTIELTEEDLALIDSRFPAPIRKEPLDIE